MDCFVAEPVIGPRVFFARPGWLFAMTPPPPVLVGETVSPDPSMPRRLSRAPFPKPPSYFLGAASVGWALWEPKPGHGRRTGILALRSYAATTAVPPRFTAFGASTNLFPPLLSSPARRPAPAPKYFRQRKTAPQREHKRSASGISALLSSRSARPQGRSRPRRPGQPLDPPSVDHPNIPQVRRPRRPNRARRWARESDPLPPAAHAVLGWRFERGPARRLSQLLRPTVPKADRWRSRTPLNECFCGSSFEQRPQKPTAFRGRPIGRRAFRVHTRIDRWGVPLVGPRKSG